MGSQDKSARGSAVPFVGHFWGQNQTDMTVKYFQDNSGYGDAYNFVAKGGQYADANMYIFNQSTTTTYTIPAAQQFRASNGSLWTLGFDLSLDPRYYDPYEYMDCTTTGAANNGLTGALSWYPSDPTGGNMTVSFNAPSADGADDIPLQKTSVGRILLPQFGPLIECYLDFNMSVPAGWGGIGVEFAIGTFSTGFPTYTANTSYTDAYIQQSWTTINGSSTPLTVSNNLINKYGINLLPALYPSGSPNYMPEGFVLIMRLTNYPSSWDTANILNTPLINTLNIHMSTTGVK